MAKAKRRMTQEEFEALLPHVGIRFNVDAAKRHLVLGQEVSKVAEDLGVGRQAVNSAAKKMWDLYLQYGNRPASWPVVSVALPEAIAQPMQEALNIIAAQARGVAGRGGKR